MEIPTLIDQLRAWRREQAPVEQQSRLDVATTSPDLERKRYTIYDSHLLGQDRDSFNTFFVDLLESEYSDPNYGMLNITKVRTSEVAEHGLKDEIENLLGNKNGHAVGLEIGGSGSVLFSEFNDGSFGVTFGACINDLRTDETITSDDTHNHHVLAGVDAFTDDGIELMRQNLPGGGKADLIIERMGGPLFGERTDLSVYPNNFFSLLRIAQGWYSLLAEGGVMYAQIPRELFIMMRDSGYIDWVKKRFGDVLDVKLGNHQLQDFRVFTLKLTKKPGAPEQLPIVGIIDYLHKASRDDRADTGIVGRVFELKMPPDQRKALIDALKLDPTQMFRDEIFWDTGNFAQEYTRNNTVSKRIFQAKSMLFDVTRQCVQEERSPSQQEVDKIKDELEKVIQFAGKKGIWKGAVYTEVQIQMLRVLHQYADTLIPLYIALKRDK